MFRLPWNGYAKRRFLYLSKLPEPLSLGAIELANLADYRCSGGPAWGHIRFATVRHYCYHSGYQAELSL